MRAGYFMLPRDFLVAALGLPSDTKLTLDYDGHTDQFRVAVEQQGLPEAGSDPGRCLPRLEPKWDNDEGRPVLATWGVQEQKANGPNHPIEQARERLRNVPKEMEWMNAAPGSGFGLTTLDEIQLDLNQIGFAYVWAVRDARGVITEMLRLDPANVCPLANGTYRVIDGDRSVVLSGRDLYQVARPASDRQQKYIIESAEDRPELSEEEIRVIRKQFEEAIASQEIRLMVLPPGATLKPLTPGRIVEADRIKLKVDRLEIDVDKVGNGTITLDGERLKGVTGLRVEMKCGHLTKISIDVLPFAPSYRDLEADKAKADREAKAMQAGFVAQDAPPCTIRHDAAEQTPDQPHTVTFKEFL